MLAGWPVDLDTALQARGIAFSSRLENQRGALALVGGRLYIPFGGNFGDCGNYHGAVVVVETNTGPVSGAWMTRARKSGIWAPGGVVWDGRSLFVATGNAVDEQAWDDQEAVIRLSPDLHHATDPRDIFAPVNWRDLDNRKKEIGGSNPIPLNVPNGPQVRRLLLQFGKDGNAYLLDRTNLGGIGGALLVQRVANSAIRTVPTAYAMNGMTFVAFQAPAALCPDGDTAELAAFAIGVAQRLSLIPAWCAPLDGVQPVPIVTTTDGSADPIVWIVGAAGDNRLHGFRGDTGRPVFNGGTASDRMRGLHHFRANPGCRGYVLYPWEWSSVRLPFRRPRIRRGSGKLYNARARPVVSMLVQSPSPTSAPCKERFPVNLAGNAFTVSSWAADQTR